MMIVVPLDVIDNDPVLDAIRLKRAMFDVISEKTFCPPVPTLFAVTTAAVFWRVPSGKMISKPSSLVDMSYFVGGGAGGAGGPGAPGAPVGP